MGWVGWSLVALVGWGTWAVLNKLALRTLDWPHLIVASWVVLTVAVAALVTGRVDPRALLSRDGAFALGAAITSLVAVICFYLAVRSGPVATITPLSSLYPAVTVLLAVLIFRETPSLTQWVGVMLAIVAGILLSRA